MIQVVFLGFGNVNQHLFHALVQSKSVEVKQVFNRNYIDFLPLRDHISFTDDLTEVADADVYIIGIPDDAIEGFSEQLPFNDRLTVHTSGAVPMEKLSGKNRRGVFYPLQSFSKQREVNFGEIPICLEAENKEDLEKLNKLARSISNNVHFISSEKRAKLHLAAVFVNNFVNYLYFIGSDILQKENLPLELLKPLILETALKIKDLSPKNAQTGPARRNDTKTIETHLSLLEDESYKNFYNIFTEALKNQNRI